MAFNKQKTLEAARKFRDKGQKDKAIKEYLKVVKEDPKDVRVWLKIGDLYAQKGEKQEATETYLKVAKFYGEQGFFLKAVAVYKQILKLDPRMVEVNLKLAELYRQLGLVSDAMQHFETVAGFFHREGKTQEALATIRQLVELDPENVATRIKLAELYSKEKMVEEAVVEFQQACDYLKRNGREDDYVKVAERLFWHKPERIELARELASLYLQRRDPRRALQKLQACFKADQRDVETLALLAQAFQALEQKGKTVSVLKELARVLTENGQRAQAQEVHRKILAYAPDDPDSLAALGRDTRAETPDPRPRQERLASIAEGAGVPAPPGPSMRPTGSMPITEPEEDLASDLSLDEPHLADGSSASAEVHADEIVKILTETDVYVKYGLHQKAVVHLRRVFELDPNNIEARERLKDIFVSQGRTGEAVAELLTLAEMTISGEPQRAEDYLRELLELDPEKEAAVELARRYRLDITKAIAPVEIVDEPSDAIEFDLGTAGPGTQQLDDVLDFADLDMDEGMVSAPPEPTAAGHHSAPETLDPREFDDLDLPSSESEPPVHLEPEPVVSPRAESELEMSIEYESYPSYSQGHAPLEGRDSTQEVSIDQVEDAEVLRADEDLDFDRPPTGDGFAAEVGEASPELLDDQVALGEFPTASDAGLGSMGHFEETADVAFVAPDAELGELTDGLEEIHDIAELGGELLEDSQVNVPVPEAHAAVTAEHAAAPPAGIAQPSDPTQQVELGDRAVADAGGELEDALDEADFFIMQGLLEEARDILTGLANRFPSNPLVQAKMSELAEAGGADAGEPVDETNVLDEPIEVAPADETGKPSVIVGNNVDDTDADTHFDLGQAYKEMGLLDEAVSEFQKVLAIHAREVQCHLMIGLCYRDQDKLSEAITQFKAGLYVSNISEAEKFGLYYEIGISYESLTDPQEALYYYEMLLKKDPDYRDVADRVAAIRGSGTESGQRRSTLDDDTDAALDGLK